MEKAEPIKRSPQLAPLSREHHDGLLFVWKIRQGLQNKTDVLTIADFIQWYDEQHLKTHFETEEKLLLPLFAADDLLFQQMQQEHTAIRRLLQAIEQDPGKETLVRLADLLYDHIRFEERKLFKYVEENLSAQQLDEIHEQLSATPACDTEWKDDFWLKR